MRDGARIDTLRSWLRVFCMIKEEVPVMESLIVLEDGGNVPVEKKTALLDLYYQCEVDWPQDTGASTRTG